ncbi:MAG TPA: germination protein YpeB [Bacilli bacterium]|nr:germination protein YpeB [Bacilli bacterium]
MIRSILIGVLSIGLIGTAFWGFQERKQSQILMNSAETNYQRAFHELVYHVDQLEDILGTVLAMNSRRQLSPQLAEVWRVTSIAQNELGELPLGLIPLNKTEEFLYNLGNFTYKAAVRDLDKQPLTKKEYQTLEKLYEVSKDIQQDLRKTQATVIQKNLRWLDVEADLVAQKEPLDNAVIDGFHIVDKKLKGFSETEWNASFSQMSQNDEDLAKKLKEEAEVSEEEAKKRALSFLHLPKDTVIQASHTGKGLAYEAYSFSIDDPDNKVNIMMDVTKKGGHPVWFLQARAIEGSKLSLNEAAEKAKHFLNRNGFKNMQLMNSVQYDNIGSFEFSYVQEDVRIYADKVILQVALDNGDVISFDGKNYLTNHRKRDLKKPTLTTEQAKKRLNPKLKVMSEHIAVIKNELDEEVLCYEYYGVIQDNTYRIFVNALDGEEELVEKLTQSSSIYEVGSAK